jgi:hypothetical protein
MSLQKALGETGEATKADVDGSIDRCGKLENIREGIIALKAAWEEGKTDQAKDEVRAKAQDALERYFHFIVYGAYLKENHESEYETSYSAWSAGEKAQALLAILGTREEGPLAEFNWV